MAIKLSCSTAKFYKSIKMIQLKQVFLTLSSSSYMNHDNPGPKPFCERQQLPYTQTSGLISPLSNLYVGNSHGQVFFDFLYFFHLSEI